MDVTSTYHQPSQGDLLSYIISYTWLQKLLLELLIQLLHQVQDLNRTLEYLTHVLEG
jgi:hypothetical protein